MKTIIFTEEQLQDPKAIGKVLFSDEQDPRSCAYVRILNRPRINWARVVLFLMVLVLVPAAFAAGAGLGLLPPLVSVAAAVVFLAVYLLLTLKKAAICAVRIYQRFAPASLRNKCRFEPSCSEYMILAIEKYGLFKGVQKGKNRLKRCNIDDGGFDFP